MATTRLRDVATLDAFLNDLPLLFRGSIYAGFLPMLPPVGGPESYRMRQSNLSGEHYIGFFLDEFYGCILRGMPQFEVDPSGVHSALG